MGRPFTCWGGIAGLPPFGQRQRKGQKKYPVIFTGLGSHSLVVASTVVVSIRRKINFIRFLLYAK